jgi:hypothetical protein
MHIHSRQESLLIYMEQCWSIVSKCTLLLQLRLGSVVIIVLLSITGFLQDGSKPHVQVTASREAVSLQDYLLNVSRETRSILRVIEVGAYCRSVLGSHLSWGL